MASRTLTARLVPSGDNAGYSNAPIHSGAYGTSDPSRATQTSVDFARSTVPSVYSAAPDVDTAKPIGATPSAMGTGPEVTAMPPRSKRTAKSPPSRPVYSRCPDGEYHTPAAFGISSRTLSARMSYT